jgi:Ser/Thr protein kinase RdoA (MazF antagonist)
MPDGTHEHDRRQRFDAHELAIVLSRYDLGVIEQIREFPRGSRRSPKVRLKTSTGLYLLKRRAPGRDDPQRVAFAHSLQLHLESRGYPVPGLIGTRGQNNSMLQMSGRIYEMFKFVRGTRLDHSPESLAETGRALGRLHALLAEYRPPFQSPVGSFHAESWLDQPFAQIPTAVAAAEPHADPQAVARTTAYLRQSYQEATARVEQAGFATWPKAIIHGDWHPGNLLFREGRVVGVLDFDSARIEPRMADVANAALQFGMRIGPLEDPMAWPVELDMAGIRGLLRGYHEMAPQSAALSPAELSSLPWLMIEALIVEAAIPIAATGSFARIRGSSFLAMVEKKVRWVAAAAARPGGLLEGVS